jgi:hypothetical protein
MREYILARRVEGYIIPNYELLIDHGDGETLIEYNGSKWAGEAPDALETFCKSLAADALDPTFEDYGDFGHEVHRDHWAGILPEKYARYTWTFWGNFLEVAGAFSIFSNHAPTIERIQALIGANQQRADYQAARVEIAERKRKAKEEETRRNIQAAAARGWV